MAEMQGKIAYTKYKVVGPFSKPYVSGSYMHRAALMEGALPFIEKTKAVKFTGRSDQSSWFRVAVGGPWSS
jgi:hypothetical protein